MTTNSRTPHYNRAARQTSGRQRSLVVPHRGEALKIIAVQATSHQKTWVSNDNEVDAIIASLEKEEKSSSQAPIVAKKHVVRPAKIVAKQTKASKTSPQPLTVAAQQQKMIHRRLGRTAKRTSLLHQSIQRESTPKKPRRGIKGLFTSRATAILTATLIVALSGYVSIDTWLTNRKVESQFVQAASGPVDEDKQGDMPADEGRDESNLPRETLKNYKVAADQPRALYIPKLKIAARLMPMGVNKDNSLQSPKNIFDAGWYNQSASPKRGGAVVVDAHASGPTREGLFAYLDTLAAGDIVTIETGDRMKFNYRVVAKETVDRNAVDMQKLMLPNGNAIQGANFITCSGKWQQKDATYSQRTIVYTELVK